MTIQIDNPEIELFFINEFKSDVKKFSEFILMNLDKYKKQNEFDVTPLDPTKHSYSLKFDNLDEVDESSNPFKDIEDVATYARKLRDSAWR
ncbi:MAG: hypothetical protein KU29_10515 [Sulfurovum sp. FS06-10]|jgi:hypothetical protein|nr:MAG: hypothetical protein KU29_10515 [Sulfurovum sp. FS06-10]